MDMKVTTSIGIGSATPVENRYLQCGLADQKHTIDVLQIQGLHGWTGTTRIPSFSGPDASHPSTVL